MTPTVQLLQGKEAVYEQMQELILLSTIVCNRGKRVLFVCLSGFSAWIALSVSSKTVGY